MIICLLLSLLFLYFMCHFFIILYIIFFLQICTRFAAVAQKIESDWYRNPKMPLGLLKVSSVFVQSCVIWRGCAGVHYLWKDGWRCVQTYCQMDRQALMYARNVCFYFDWKVLHGCCDIYIYVKTDSNTDRPMCVRKMVAFILMEVPSWLLQHWSLCKNRQQYRETCMCSKNVCLYFDWKIHHCASSTEVCV